MLTGNSLILILLLGIAFIVFSTSKFKLHPFLALLIAAYGIALAAGMPLNKVSETITAGFGKIMAYIGVVIVLGTIIGIILERSGAAIKIADVILKCVGEKRPTLAMSLIGAVVSIPVFCDSGFVILSSLNKSLIHRTRASAVAMSVALATGLFATHTLVPPTPGPIAAAANLKLEDSIGLVILFGLGISVFTVLAGYLCAIILGSKHRSEWDDFSQVSLEKDPQIQEKYGQLPNTLNAFMPILLPIILMSLGSVLKLSMDKTALESGFLTVILFLTTPTTALLVGLLSTLPLLPKLDEQRLFGWVNDGVTAAGGILIITGAGGALGAVLSATNIGAYLGEVLKTLNLGIFVPFILAAALKTAQGSSTTALVVASSLVYPLLQSLGLDSQTGRLLTCMAVGAGAMTVSHANDSFFWVVSQFSKMPVNVAYKTFTLATLAQGITTMAVVYILSLVML